MATFITYVVLVPNLLICLLGLALTGFGAWWIAAQPGFFPGGADLSLGFAIAVTAVGAFAAVISFLGCCGAAFQNKCLLILYVFIMGIICAACFAGGIICLTRIDWLKEALRSTMKAEVDVIKPDDGLFVFAHKRYGCCGIDDQLLCDRSYPPVLECPMLSPKCNKGCLNPLWDEYLGSYTHVGAGILLGLSVLMAIAVMLAMYLICYSRH